MNANEEVAEDLLKLVIKKDNLTTVFWQQIQLEQDHCILRIKMLNIYYVSHMFSLNIHGLNI